MCKTTVLCKTIRPSLFYTEIVSVNSTCCHRRNLFIFQIGKECRLNGYVCVYLVELWELDVEVSRAGLADFLDRVRSKYSRLLSFIVDNPQRRRAR
jgi:hypothetical protein